jgi:sugar phosphate permease
LALALLGNSSALLPALNSQVFGGNKETLGLLMAATPLGGVFAMAVSGVLKRAANLQAVLISCAVAWAICLLCLALSSWLALSLAMLALMGMFDSVAVVVRSTIVQLHTPDRLRGRISSVEYIVGNAAAQLGNVRAGLLGTILSVPTALALTSATTLLAVLFAPAIAMTLRKQALRNA